jgi:hypothetical protein
LSYVEFQLGVVEANKCRSEGGNERGQESERLMQGGWWSVVPRKSLCWHPYGHAVVFSCPREHKHAVATEIKV